jgi:geranylgeranyl diphosphate synthase, type I
MECQKMLQRGKERIDGDMKRYLAEKKQSLAPGEGFFRTAFDHVEDILLSGGKRLRGNLLVQGYQAGGGTNQEAAWRAALGIEFIHAYLLIHDDIMDKDTLRHGVKTLHARYAEFATTYFPEKDAEHFGQSIAITLGDMLSSWGNECVFTADLDHDCTKKALQKIQQTVHRTGMGQIRDMYIGFAGSATEEEILAMYQDKTAYYSLEAPLQIGLALAGGNQELETFFTQYALPLGVAFQLQDDLLGLFGDEKKTGKTKASDVREGKYTLAMHKTRELVSGNDQKEIDRILALGDKLSLEEVDWVCNKVEESGARALVEGRIQELVSQSLDVLTKQKNMAIETRNFLQGFAEMLVDRKM